MTESGQEVFIDLTREEAATLCELLSIPTPPGLDPPDLDQLSLSGDGDRLRQAALASLRSRGMIDESDPSVVAAPIVEVMTTSSRPGVVAAASVQHRGRTLTRHYSALPDVGIEHSALSLSLFRFTPFATRDLLSRLLGFVDLRPSAAVRPRRFRLPVHEMAELLAWGASGRRGDVIDRLGGHGVDGETAELFAIALSAEPRSIGVTVLHRPDDDTVAGGTLSWLDAGLSGLWRVEADDVGAPTAAAAGSAPAPTPDSGKTMVEIEAVDATTIATELLGYLPPAFADIGTVLPSPR